MLPSAPPIAKALSISAASAAQARSAAGLVARLALAEAGLSNASSSERLLAWTARGADAARAGGAPS